MSEPVKMTKQGVRDLGYGKRVSRTPAPMPPTVARAIDQAACRHWYEATGDCFTEQCVHCGKVVDAPW